MSDVLRDLSRVQAVRPTCHWWRCPRLLAWFRVLMMVSLVKRPASAGLLSRIGDYLLLQHEGLGSDKNMTDSAWHGHHQRRPCSTGPMTRSPPQPLFHRRCVPMLYDYLYMCNPRDSKWTPLLIPTLGAIWLKPWRGSVTTTPQSLLPAKMSARWDDLPGRLPGA
jgi:hypothetical protein